MKIVHLDGFTQNPGDLSWDGIAQFGELTVYDRTPPDQIVARVQGAELILTNKTPLTRETLEQLPGLRYVGVTATGYNIVDVAAAKELGIIVTNIPTYGTDSVAQMTFALLLELCRRVGAHSEAVRSGMWSLSPDFCFWLYPQMELTGRTMGIIGFGRIGRQVARIASACCMKVIASDVTRGNPPNIERFRWVETPEALAESDVISVHAPLTPETDKLINRNTIALMKQTALLINTSRGQLVADADLAEALNDRRIAGAGLDVLSLEPPPPDNPLLSARNCIITPHIAWATKEARMRMMDISVTNLRAFLEGRPVNVVNP